MMKDKIKEIRSNLNLTQKEFASLINKSVATVKNYEAGKTVPGEEVLNKICEAANVSKEFLMEKAGDAAVAAVEVMEKAGEAAEKLEETVAPVAEKAVPVLKDAAEGITAAEIEVKKNTRKAARKVKKAVEEAVGEASAKAEEAVKPPTIIIESRLGGQITTAEILSRLPGNVSQVYVKPEENKAYWVKGDETGEIDLW